MAKRHIYKLFDETSRTFYCDCPYEDRRILSPRCSFSTNRFPKRRRRTEIEHVVPAEAFGRSFLVWREGHAQCVSKGGKPFKGRKCAERVSLAFRQMHADLYNLKPAIGALNALRRNYRMGMIEDEVRAFGACDVEISDRRFEPRGEIRGDIARIYFYMDAAYPGRGVLSKKQRKLFLTWHRLDPVSESERRLARKIEAIQGNANPFVTGDLEPH